MVGDHSLSLVVQSTHGLHFKEKGKLAVPEVARVVKAFTSSSGYIAVRVAGTVQIFFLIMSL